MKTKICLTALIKIFFGFAVFFIQLASCSSINKLPCIALDIEFTLFANGALVDTRISENSAAMIFKHFQAIEDGDLSAFRDTLSPDDIGDTYHHVHLIIKYFGDFFENSEQLAENVHSLNQETVNSAFHDLFYKEYPLKNRDTGLRVLAIRQSISTGKIIVDLTNNESNHITYLLIGGNGGINYHYNIE